MTNPVPYTHGTSLLPWLWVGSVSKARQYTVLDTVTTSAFSIVVDTHHYQVELEVPATTAHCHWCVVLLLVVFGLGALWRLGFRNAQTLFCEIQITVE